VAVRAALLLSLAVLIWQLVLFYPEVQQPVSDFTEYWAAGRLLLQGENPYDPVQMGAMQRALGRPNVNPLLMYNPPWTLSVLLPFAVLSYGLGKLAWILFQGAALLFSVDRLWQLYGGDPRLRWLAWGLGVSFVPVLFALNEGQLMPLVLLGLVAFLEFVDHQHGGWAGAALVVASFKPQLLYLLLLAVLCWVVSRHQWKVIWGGLGGLAAMLVIPAALRPQLIPEYLYFVLHEPLSRWAPPTLGTLLRLWWGHEHFWLQFMPVLIGLAWFIWLWSSERQHWDWRKHLPRLLLASMTLNAYGWVHDQTILLIAVIAMAVPLIQKAARPWLLGAAGAYFILNGVLIALQLARVGELGYVWLAPVWWGGYTILQRHLQSLPRFWSENIDEEATTLA